MFKEQEWKKDHSDFLFTFGIGEVPQSLQIGSFQTPGYNMNVFLIFPVANFLC